MKSILAIAVSLLTINSFAYTTTGVVGLRMNHAIVDVLSSKDRLGVQAGVIVGLPLNENITFRTGGILAMKDSEAEGTASGFQINGVFKHLFLDIPATLQFGNEVFQGYAGFNLAVKVSSSCEGKINGVAASSCSYNDEKSLVIQPIIGADFKVSNSMKIGAFYELEAEYAKDLKQSAFGVQAGFDF